MSEIINATGKTKGDKISKKLSTKVDLTPMVDVGFLLITFFVFTTTQQQPKGMKLFLPNDKQTIIGSEVGESRTLTFLLNSDSIFYYQGNNLNAIKSIPYSAIAIRKILSEKKKSLLHKQTAMQREPFVFIKPTNNSNYKNLVDVLDEMTINTIKYYMLTDINLDEQKRVGI